MVRHDRRRIIAAAVAVGALLTSCGTGGDGDDAADPVPPPVTDATDTPTTSSDVRSTVAPPGTEAEVSGPPAASASTVTVSGGQLPSLVVDGYATNGGDLVTPQEWQRRFGESGLPGLTGPGVGLVEALQRSERTDQGWVRTDEASWLTISTDDRDSMIAVLGAAAGVGGTPTRTASIDKGADCVIDTYPPAGLGVEWKMQGCSYEQFPRMLSLGVSRAAPVDMSPAAVDPTVTAMVEALDGAVAFTEVRFGAPGPDGATLQLSAQVHSQVGLDDAVTAAFAGPVAGWQRFAGDGSLLLSGPTGATWTLSDRVAVFTWAGRW